MLNHLVVFRWMNDDMIKSLTPHLLGRRPNTYTLTKALAEVQLVEDSGHLPVVIVRPSIIGAVWKEPIPGWMDNLNGATGIFAAVSRSFVIASDEKRMGMDTSSLVEDLTPFLLM